MFNIAMNSNRPLRSTNEKLMDCFLGMVERWNIFVDSRRSWPTDGRTREYKAMREMQESIIFMYDKIVQVERENFEKVRRLEFELSKWTKNQKGRKLKLTEAQRKEIKKARSDGESLRKIAQRYAVSEATIRRVTAPNAIRLS